MNAFQVLQLPPVEQRLHLAYKANDVLKAKLRSYQAPKPKADTVRYVYQHKQLGQLDCDIWGEAGEKASADCPGCDDIAEVRAVYLRGVEISELLSEPALDAISNAYMKGPKNDA